MTTVLANYLNHVDARLGILGAVIIIAATITAFYKVCVDVMDSVKDKAFPFRNFDFA
jgi:hypothetical protein